MSYRIHRAMGWGMSWSDFEQFFLPDCEVQDTDQKLDEIMAAATVRDLSVPMELRNKLFYSEERPRKPIIMDPVLLAKDLEFQDIGIDNTRMRIHPKGFHSPRKLYQLVATPDGITHILFWPTGSTGTQWNRASDDLDYVFEQYRDGTDDGAPEDFVREMKFNPYPFSNYIMDPATGAPLEWEPYFMLDKAYPDGWVPSPPSELRWWLPALGILYEADVLKLRPMLAQWWC